MSRKIFIFQKINIFLDKVSINYYNKSDIKIMEKTLKVINKMVSEGVIGDYAIAGSIGVFFYTQSFPTKDLDIIVYPQKTPSGIIHFSKIYLYLKSKGYKIKGQNFIIEGVPVDFIAPDKLMEEALENAVTKTFGKTKTKVLKPEYLYAIALKTGRKQDFRKIDLLSTETLINKKLLANIVQRHNIKWKD
jgi:hypothetical protein